MESPLPTTSHTPSSVTSLVRVGELASGGMGRVELAMREEGEFRRLYAVKRLHPHLHDESEFRDMFLDEARVAGLLDHPNIVSVLDVGEDAQGPFLVMSFVDGMSLRELMHLAMSEEIDLPVQTCVRIALEMAKGLHEAHEVTDHSGRKLDLVHRDLSPHNVLIGWDGTVRITDFGIAKALGRRSKTATGVVKGKAAYMSPEQLRYERIDHRSDLFSLGVVLFEMLAGRRVYKNEEENDGIRRILHEPPPDIGEERPEVPPALAALLFELLAKDRETRPETGAVVAARLEGILVSLLADESPVDVRAVVEDIAGDIRQQRAEDLAAKLERAHEQPAPSLARADGSEVSIPIDVTLSQPQPKRRVPWLAVATVGALALSAPLAWFLLSPDEPAVAAPSPEPVTAPEPESPAPEPTPVVAATDAPDPEPVVAEPEAEAPAPRPNRRRRRRRRARPAAETPNEASSAGSSRWDSWD